MSPIAQSKTLTAALGDSERRSTWQENVVPLTFGKRVLPVVYPRWTDPRYIQIGSLMLFAFLGQMTYGFQITQSEIFLVVLLSAAIDTVLTLLIRKKLIFPASGLIAGLGMAMLLRVRPDAPFYAVYALAATLAILSKYLLTVKTDTGRKHVFNPSNFGLVCCLLLLPGTAYVTPDQWDPSYGLLLVFFALGALLIWRAKVTVLALSFITAECVLLLIRSGVALNPTAVASSLLGFFVQAPTIIVFTFHMVTDPRTMPRIQSHRILFGVLVAMLHWLFVACALGRMSVFLALFCGYAGYWAIRLIRNRMGLAAI